MRSILKVALGAVMTASALTGAAVSPAQAAPAELACAANYVCMFEDAGLVGDKYVNVVGRPGFYDIDWWNGDNEISSVQNRTGYWIRMYADDDWTGFFGCVAPGQILGSLSEDNEMESFQLDTNCR